MKTVEISYNPYKMKTKMYIDGKDVCTNRNYEKIKDFIVNEIPLQTWIEPIEYLDWDGFVNEISDTEINDEINVIFSGRKIDFEDLKRSITDQNKKRSEETRVIYHYNHKKELDDKILSQNIEEVVQHLKSERFSSLVTQRSTESLTKKYAALTENYAIAKESVFYIVFAGAYSSGKSTLLNAIIRHEILPTSTRTCTSKNCRIRHDSSLGNNVSLACYDKDDNIVINKTIFNNDAECAAAFLEICPINDKHTQDTHPDIYMMELGVNLSHLYPDSVNEDKFTIVLIDTPGMDSAQSSEDGTNRHAEIALDAISMESKPMIILCADANYSDNKCIGEFMKEIIVQSKEENSGFNDRFLFLMNKCDSIVYTKNETAENNKREFAEYLTDSSKWNIKGDEEELKQLAEGASHFVPRIFMTAGLIAFAIQCGAANFSDDELDDPYKDDLNDKLRNFMDKICGCRKRTPYYLSRYCDIPNYRKDELEEEFNIALSNDDKIKATEIQCGLLSVELAIKDYIERYAYPIKVRGLLDTFEDILYDVDSFSRGFHQKLQSAGQNLGEKSNERKEASERKESVQDKIDTLQNVKIEIENQLSRLNEIEFDSTSLHIATNEFKADIEEDNEISFIRSHPKVETGQKSHYEVENEINNRIYRIKVLFDRTLYKTNNKLEEIKTIHDGQVNEIFRYLQSAIIKLESSGVFKQGEYSFTDSVLWQMNFANINYDKFSAEMKKNVVDKTTKTVQVRNHKKDEWRSSWNPFKKLGSLFMDDYKTEIKTVNGYYSTTTICQSIDDYLYNLQKASDSMENSFKEILDNSKRKVRNLIEALIQELNAFLLDINMQDSRIKNLSKSIDDLKQEIEYSEDNLRWLAELKEKIKGE